MMVWYQKHTQFPGPGRTNENVVGYPLMPIYMAKAGGFFFVVFGTIVALAGLFQINPIWAYGPYIPDQVTAGSQPDWYVGFLDGALRLMPPIEITQFGHTLSLNLIIPAMVLAPVLLVLRRGLSLDRALRDRQGQSASTTCSTVRATPRRARPSVPRC